MKRVENSRILFLDEAPIRRLLEFHSEWYPVVLRVLDIVYERNILMVASPLSLSNLCQKAYEKSRPVLVRELKEFFLHSSQLQLRPIDAEIATVSAEFRARSPLSLGESLQLATAYVCGADLVLTEDPNLKNVSDMDVVTLSELH